LPPGTISRVTSPSFFGLFTAHELHQFDGRRLVAEAHPGAVEAMDAHLCRNAAFGQWGARVVLYLDKGEAVAVGAIKAQAALTEGGIGLQPGNAKGRQIILPVRQCASVPSGTANSVSPTSPTPAAL